MFPNKTISNIKNYKITRCTNTTYIKFIKNYQINKSFFVVRCKYIASFKKLVSDILDLLLNLSSYTNPVTINFID